MDQPSLPDNGGRRSGIDRRQNPWDFHIPEWQSGIDRRSGNDRSEIKGQIKGRISDYKLI